MCDWARDSGIGKYCLNCCLLLKLKAGDGEPVVGSCAAGRLREGHAAVRGIERIPIAFRSGQEGVTHPEQAGGESSVNINTTSLHVPSVTFPQCQ